ncbi:MFS transporter, partial [Telmatospirillum sp.]|uniref:MFS transporter n=1 Tax=Telmatospirillum sp. TaxID=2079197 RepID=UPI00284801DD
GQRKPLILLGYGLAALSKPLFPLAASPIPVLGARFIDRIGKGLRDAPRDALLADVTPLAIRGRAYGLRQALDTVGAFAGPLAAIGLMAIFANNMRAVFWVAVVPGFIAVLLVAFGVKGQPRDNATGGVQAPLRLADLRRLDRRFWAVVAIGVLFTMAGFSEAFLVLKANADGLPLALAPLVLVVMNLVYSLGAYPAGALSDAGGPQRPLVYGLACLVAADVCLASGKGLIASFVGIALWGAYLALTQGLLAQLVAERAPENLRGSAFGLFNLATGVAMLAANALAGMVWDHAGPSAAFITGGGFAALTAMLLLFGQTLSKRRKTGER